MLAWMVSGGGEEVPGPSATLGAGPSATLRAGPSATLRAGPGDGAIVEDEVVAVAVSPGLGDGEAALAGLVEEGGFGTLSGALGVGAGVALGHRELLGDLPGCLVISDSYYNRRGQGL